MDPPSPRGKKRKGSDTLPLPAPRRIKALAQDVVNKIAAGEIIVAPVHALKELVENAVDAGATSLEVLVKDGGLKLLQITDNGCGIPKDDLPILCERFTTSKLQAFEDLTQISTYGFRGEALASISHIAHLRVATRTKESSCAWEASYADGRLTSPKPGQKAEPRSKAGRQGTQITVEDLFYNVPSRRRAFRSASEEYAKILDLVGRYAVHCAGVAFSCKKAGDSSGSSVSIPAAANTKDRIRQLHGATTANELVQLKVEDERWGFKCDGWMSTANHSSKRTNLLLFINHRAVESSVIKKSLEQTYATFLPKGGHPFVYLSLEIEPQRVDVNVHPTKREVHFLNEDEILAVICDGIRENLSKVDTSRMFGTQSLLKQKVPLLAATPAEKMAPNTPAKQAGSNTAGPSSRGDTNSRRIGAQRPYENNLVRTDSSVRKITTMLQPQRSVDTNEPVSDGNAMDTDNPVMEDSLDIDSDSIEYTHIDREPSSCPLTSIRELRAEVRDAMHNDLTDMISTHIFVGFVDSSKRIAAIQAGVKLFLVDYGMLANEYFYQVGLTDFGNFGTIRFNPPLSLHELLTLAVEAEQQNAPEADVDWAQVIESVHTLLISKGLLLKQYLSMEISPEGELCAIPLLLKNYTPSLAKLPQFLLRLGPHVNWETEKKCFEALLRELASFYVPERLPVAPAPMEAGGEEKGNGEGVGEKEREEISIRQKKVLKAVEETIFPACKARMVGTKGLLKGVMEVANLKGLYRVFERC